MWRLLTKRPLGERYGVTAERIALLSRYEMRTVVVIRSQPVDPEPRVEKVARALHDAGWKVIVLAWDRWCSSDPRETREFGEIVRCRIRGYFARGLRNAPFLLVWNLAAFLWLLKNRNSYSHLHACDFDTLLPAFAIRVLFRKPVVYDIYDFYADVDPGNPLRSLSRPVDLNLISKVDAVILADESRLKQIRGTTPNRLAVIYNSPEQALITGRMHTENTYRLRIGYIGLMQVERGLLPLLDVMAVEQNWRLDLGGYGRDQQIICDRAMRLDNVRFHGRLPYDKVMDVYARANVILATYDPSIPNHRFSSANKLFEAMMLGKAIVVARDTGMDQIVEAHCLGRIVQYGDSADLREALAEFASWSPEAWEEFSRHARGVYSAVFSWSVMKSRLQTLYSTLPARVGGRGRLATA